MLTSASATWLVAPLERRNAAAVAAYRGYTYQALVALRWCLNSIEPDGSGYELQALSAEVGEDFRAIWSKDQGRDVLVQWVQVKSSEGVLDSFNAGKLLAELFKSWKRASERPDRVTIVSPGEGYDRIDSLRNALSGFDDLELFLEAWSRKTEGRLLKSVWKQLDEPVEEEVLAFLRIVDTRKLWSYTYIQAKSFEYIASLARGNKTLTDDLLSQFDHLTIRIQQLFAGGSGSLRDDQLVATPREREDDASVDMRTITSDEIRQILTSVDKQSSHATAANLEIPLAPGRLALYHAARSLHASMYDAALILQEEPRLWPGLQEWRTSRTVETLPRDFLVKLLLATDAFAVATLSRSPRELINDLNQIYQLNNERLETVNNIILPSVDRLVSAQINLQKAELHGASDDEVARLTEVVDQWQRANQFAEDVHSLFIADFDMSESRIRGLIGALVAPPSRVHF